MGIGMGADLPHSSLFKSNGTPRSTFHNELKLPQVFKRSFLFLSKCKYIHSIFSLLMMMIVINKKNDIYFILALLKEEFFQI